MRLKPAPNRCTRLVRARTESGAGEKELLLVTCVFSEGVVVYLRLGDRTSTCMHCWQEIGTNHNRYRARIWSDDADGQATSTTKVSYVSPERCMSKYLRLLLIFLEADRRRGRPTEQSNSPK